MFVAICLCCCGRRRHCVFCKVDSRLQAIEGCERHRNCRKRSVLAGRNGELIRRMHHRDLMNERLLKAADELAQAAFDMFGPTKDKDGEESDRLDEATSNYYIVRKEELGSVR